MDKSTLILIGTCATIVEDYILEMKGKRVKIALPLHPHEYNKFIQAFNVACVYYNLTIKI